MPKPSDIPPCPQGLARPPSDRVVQEYKIHLITPLFGGGVDVRMNDPSRPIRESAIRGQLRFWWRATRGRRFGHTSALSQQEEAIFGSTQFPSPLCVEVESFASPAFVEKTAFQSGPARYALFALQDGDQLIREGLEFRLKLTWISVRELALRRKAQNKERLQSRREPLPPQIEDIADDLRDAVWAWVNFGGLGGRTRRGLGSLLGKEVDGKGNVTRELAPRSVAEIEVWFRSAEQRFGRPPDSAAQWPRLGEHLFYRPQAESPVDAWLTIVALFREFRQGAIGRDQPHPGGRPGRSHFPEPETIRETIRNRDRRGGTHPPLKGVPADAFPRAEFGLPIVFQFQRNEVEQTVLYPRLGEQLSERMASPLILKPLCLADGTAVPAIIPLDVPWFTDVDLTLGGRNNVRRTFPLSAVRRRSLAAYPNSPLAASPDGSAIEAFLAFAQNADNFRRV